MFLIFFLSLGSFLHTDPINKKYAYDIIFGKMTTMEIISLISIIVIIIYFILAIVYAFQMRSFYRQINKRKDAIDVLTAQKYDLLRMIGKLFVRFQIDVPQEFILSKRPRFEDTLQNIKDTERTIVKSFLVQTAQALFYYGEQNQALSVYPEYVSLKKSLAEVDELFRKQVAIYNADATNYNFWQKFLLFRWVAILFRHHLKDLIS